MSEQDPVRPGATPELDGATLQRLAIRGMSWTLLHTAVSLPVAFVANVLLARFLGVEGYGRLAVLTAALEIAIGLIDIGTSAALIQLASKRHATGDAQGVRDLLSRTQGFRVLVVGPAMTLFVVLFLDVSGWTLAVALAFGVWIPACLGGVVDCLAVENRTDRGAQNAIVTNLVTQVATVGAAGALAASADTVWAVRFAVAALGPLLALHWVSPAYRRAVLRPRLPRGFPPGFWRFALPTAAAGIVGGLVVTRSEVLLLTWLSDAEQVGLYAMAFGLASHLFAPASALTQPLVPAISGLHQVDPRKVTEALGRVLRVTGLVTGGLLSVVLPVVVVLVPTLYGGEYLQARWLLVVLAFSGALTTLAGPVTAFVYARLAAGRTLTANLCALAVDAAVALALVPVIGAWGAAAACTAAASVRLLVLVLDEVRAGTASWAGAATATRALVVGAVVSLPVTWVAEQPHPAVGAPLGLVLGLFGYLLLVRLLGAGITAQDAGALTRALPAAVSGAATTVLRTVVRAPGPPERSS